jgi:hypothetical protein
MCLGGALNCVEDGQPSTTVYNIPEIMEPVAAAILANYRDRIGWTDANLPNVPPDRIIMAFNDHRNTTWDDVERVLEKVIAG